MDLQVLIATMNQKNHDLLEKMNINSSAIVGNQCDFNRIEQFNYKGNEIQYYSFNERGVGLNRNTVFMRATADICLFADDDVVYGDHYKELILEEFKKHEEADVIVFNFNCTPEERREDINTKFARLRWLSCLRYCTYRIAVRTERVRKADIYFSLLFGGGAKYGSGEDCIFLSECFKKGLKVYCSPLFLGNVHHEDSTWFNGYNEKLFIDKGALFTKVSTKFAKVLFIGFLQFLSARQPMIFKGDISLSKAYRLMKKGGKEFLS